MKQLVRSWPDAVSKVNVSAATRVSVFLIYTVQQQTRQGKSRKQADTTKHGQIMTDNRNQDKHRRPT